MTAPEPRPYQRRAHAALGQAIRDGKRRPLLVSPTGSGKTYMLARVCADAVSRGKRVAWFAHRRELVSQAAEALTLRGLSVGANGLNASAPVQVVSVQGGLAKGEVPPADLVVLDEAHHFAADLWQTIPEAYPGAVILGATATPERGDGRPLDLFDALLVVAQPRELVAAGHLVPCETLRPGRIQPKGRIAQKPCLAYVNAGLSGKRNVVFAPTLEDARQFKQEFSAAHIRAEVISGDMVLADRDAYLSDFARGSLKVLINVYVLTEGWDCPATEVVTFARHFGSAGAFIQCGGRGLRVSPGKSHLTLLDLSGATYVHGDLLEDREYSLDGEGISRKASPSGSFCRVCGVPLEMCECGAGARELELLKATNDPLVRFAVIRRDGDEQRAARLAKWINEATGRGRKWQSALYRYSGAYGAAPPAAIVSQALALAYGKAWCNECKHSKCRCAPTAGAGG